MTGVVEIGDQRWYPVPKKWDPTGVRKKWPSVTTFGSIVDSPELRDWHGMQAARCFADDLERMAGLVAAGKADEAVRKAAGEPHRIRDRAAALGKLVHKVLKWEVRGQAYVLTDDEHKLVGPYLDTVRRMVDDLGLEIGAAECAVYHQWWEYGGTLDLFAAATRMPIPIVTRRGELLRMVEPGEPGVWDTKTGKGSALEDRGGPQIVGYTSATHWDPAGTGEVEPMPQTDWGAFLHLQPPHYRVIGVHVTPAARNALYLARQLFRAVREEPPKITGMPVRAGGIHVRDMSFIDKRARPDLTIGGVFTLADVAALGRRGFTGFTQIGDATADKAERLMRAVGMQWAGPDAPEREEEGVA